MLEPAEQPDEVGGSFYLALYSESFEAIDFWLQGTESLQITVLNH